MVIDDVVVEVSKHRGIGRMYLTNFRWVHVVVLFYSNLFNLAQLWWHVFIFLGVQFSIMIKREKCNQSYFMKDAVLFICRLVILCHLSGLTAAGYTYVSNNNNYCSLSFLTATKDHKRPEYSNCQEHHQGTSIILIILFLLIFII